MIDLNQSVIQLHNVARIVEQTLGQGKLSIDIRKCADRLNEALKMGPPKPNTAKGDQ